MTWINGIRLFQLTYSVTWLNILLSDRSLQIGSMFFNLIFGSNPNFMIDQRDLFIEVFCELKNIVKNVLYTLGTVFKTLAVSVVGEMRIIHEFQGQNPCSRSILVTNCGNYEMITEY